MNTRIIVLNIICLSVFQMSFLVSSDVGKKWIIEDYIKAFRGVLDHHNEVAYERDSYDKQHAASYLAQATLINRLKNDPCSRQVFNCNNLSPVIDIEYLKMLISAFDQTIEEYNKSHHLADEYNRLHGLSDRSWHTLHSFDNELWKSKCFSQSFDSDLSDLNYTAADLIEIREKCNEKYKDYTRSLAEYNEHLKSRGLK